MNICMGNISGELVFVWCAREKATQTHKRYNFNVRFLCGHFVVDSLFFAICDGVLC